MSRLIRSSNELLRNRPQPVADDDVQNFAYICERYVEIFEAHDANVWVDVPTDRLQHIQKEIPTSVLHLTLDTDRRTQGALSGVMRIGFDFDIVDRWTKRD